MTHKYLPRLAKVSICCDTVAGGGERCPFVLKVQGGVPVTKRFLNRDEADALKSMLDDAIKIHDEFLESSEGKK